MMIECCPAVQQPSLKKRVWISIAVVLFAVLLVYLMYLVSVRFSPTPEEEAAEHRRKVLVERHFMYLSHFRTCLEYAPRGVYDGAATVEACRVEAERSSVFPGTEHIK